MYLGVFFFFFWLRYRPHSLFKKRCSVWRFEKTMYHLDEMGTIWIRNVCSVWMKNRNILTPSRCNALTRVGFAIGSYFFLKKNKKMIKFWDPNGWKLCSKWMKYILSFRSQVWFWFRLRIRVSVTYKFLCYLQWILTLTFILPGPGDRWFENMVCFYSFFFLFFLLHFCAAIYYRKVRPNQWILRVGNHTFPMGFLTLLQIVCGQ